MGNKNLLPTFKSRYIRNTYSNSPIYGTLGPYGIVGLAALVVAIIFTMKALKKHNKSAGVIGIISSLILAVCAYGWRFCWVEPAKDFFYTTTAVYGFYGMIALIVVSIVLIILCIVGMTKKTIEQPAQTKAIAPTAHNVADDAKQQEIDALRREMEQMRQQMQQVKPVVETKPAVEAKPVSTVPDTSANVRAESQQVQAAQTSAKDVQPATSTKNKWIVLLIAAAVVFALARVESAVEYMSRGMSVTNAFTTWQVWLYLAGIVVAFFARKHVACLAVSGVITLYWGYNTGRTFFMLLSGARFVNGGIGVILGFLAPCLLLIYLGITLFQKMKHPATSQEAMLRDKLLTQTQKIKTQTDKLNNSSSGYSYLDEYKKSMNKK